MFLSREEIENAEETLDSLETKGKVAVLAMVQNRIINMSYEKKYSNCPSCRDALENILEWIRIPLAEEISKLGSQTEIRYVNIPCTLVTKSFEEILSENAVTSNDESCVEIIPENREEKANA